MVTYGTVSSNGTSAAVWYSWVTDDMTNTTTSASSANTWRVWAGETAASDASNGTVWGQWIAVDGASLTTNADTNAATVWVEWNRSGTQVIRQVYQAPPRPSASTPAEMQARLEKEAKEKAEADARANELLEAYLTDEQRRQLRELDAFIVDLKSKQYRIRRGWAGNVDEIKDGMVVARHCIHPISRVPYGDHMLAQKLMLENNEAEFLRIANRTRLSTPEPLAN